MLTPVGVAPVGELDQKCSQHKERNGDDVASEGLPVGCQFHGGEGQAEYEGSHKSGPREFRRYGLDRT